MSNQILYEFDWELLSADGGDVLDHNHFLSFDHKTTLAEAKKQLGNYRIDLSSLDPEGISKEKEEDGAYKQFVVVKDVMDDYEGVINRDWAYLNERNELDKFCCGDKVPQYIKKFFNLVTTEDR